MFKGAKINLAKDGATPLFIAMQNGHRAIVELLLSKAADTGRCHGGFTTPAEAASHCGHQTIAKLLLSSTTSSSGSADGTFGPLITSQAPRMLKDLEGLMSLAESTKSTSFPTSCRG